MIIRLENILHESLQNKTLSTHEAINQQPFYKTVRLPIRQLYIFLIKTRRLYLKGGNEFAKRFRSTIEGILNRFIPLPFSLYTTQYVPSSNWIGQQATNLQIGVRIPMERLN